jgi:DNA repair photolyase
VARELRIWRLSPPLAQRGDARGIGVSRPDAGRRGRGAAGNPPNRYAATRTEAYDDGWQQDPLPPLPTTLAWDASRTVIARNDSPDLPFDRSINPYRGCEHGCIYCYARPGHAWLGHSPGLDFETRLYAKADAAARLTDELAAPGYRCAPIALGSYTDAYQPVEHAQQITRSLLEVLTGCGHPVTLVTKSALIERDLDLLADMAARGLAAVRVSISTLQPELARRLEPRAASPARRLATITRLREAGVAVGVLVAPVIPVLTDPEMEKVLAAARDAGANEAEYVLLRLPREVAGLFRDWLAAHVPGQAARVMARVQDTRGGQDDDARFGRRMVGSGLYAELLAKRFRVAAARLGFRVLPPLRTDLFRPPARGGQLSLL